MEIISLGLNHLRNKFYYGVMASKKKCNVYVFQWQRIDPVVHAEGWDMCL
jgi:hypothetical protein